MRFAFTVAVLAASGGYPVRAQEGAKPAPVLQIIREAIKEGRGAAHEKVEADYVATFRNAKHPANYVALSALSGPGEVWFITPQPSFAITEEYDKAAGKEPLKSALAMVEARDGELRSSSRTMYAVYRPDMSYSPNDSTRQKPVTSWWKRCT